MRFNRRDILRAVAGLPFVGSLFAVDVSAETETETDSDGSDDPDSEYGSVDSFETDSGTSDTDEEEDDGYGDGEYGDGPFGDPEEEEDDSDDSDDDDEDDEDEDEPEPTADPVITLLDVADTSNPRNPHADIRVDWAAEVSEGELDTATLTVEGAFMEYYELDGQWASETEVERVHHGGGQTYPVELVVRTEHGTETVETTEVKS